MGLSNDDGDRVKWLYVSKGRFVIGKGDDKREFKKLSGLVTGISFRDKEFEHEGKKKKWREIVLRVEDDGDAFQFGLDIDTGYGSQLMFKIVNADLKSVITFEPTYEEDTKYSGMFVSQGGLALKQKWTRENPGDLPPLEKIDFDGEIKWKRSTRRAWLEKYFVDNVCQNTAASVAAVKEISNSANEEADESDDYSAEVPF